MENNSNLKLIMSSIQRTLKNHKNRYFTLDNL